MKLKLRAARIILIAAFGAFFSALYPFIALYGNILRVGLLLLFPILIKKPKRFREYMTVLAAFFSVSLALAGMFIMLNGFTTKGLTFSPITYGAFPILISVSAVLLGLTLKSLTKNVGSARAKNGNIFRALIANKNFALETRAFFDSGNRVFAENGDCIVFVSPAVYNKLLPAKVSEVYVKTVGGGMVVPFTDVFIEVYFDGGENKLYKAGAASSLTPFDGYDVLLNGNMGCK